MTKQRATPKIHMSPSNLLLLLASLYLIPFISQDLNLNADSKQRVHSQPLAAATIIQHHFNSSASPLPLANLNNNNHLNNQTTTNSQEFLLNLVKNSYKTGANASNNATTISSSATSAATASAATSSQSSSSTSAQSQASSSPLSSQAAGSAPNRSLLPARSAQPMHYQTTYACEGNQLDFGCQDGKTIHLVRAIYGRFSLSICNEQGYSNYSVNCVSFKAFLLMETRCNKLNNCSVNVSEELFGDPCPGTSKYLEVQYYCQDAANNNHSQQNHHQQVPIQRTNSLASQAGSHHHPQFAAAATQHSNNNNNQLATNGAAATPRAPSSNNDTAHKSPSAANIQQPGGGGQPRYNQAGSSSQVIGSSRTTPSQQSSDDDDSSSFSDLPDQASTVIQQQLQGQQQQLYCAPQTSARNLHWNYTRAGRVAKQKCPDGFLGEASWRCDAEKLRFLPAWSPDFSQCRLGWLERLSQQLDRMLDSPGKQQQSAPEMMRAQNELILKQVLTDLTLLVRTNELFGDDIERIDIMIAQILTHFKSLSVVFGSLDSWRSPILQGGARNNNFAFLYEELFRKLVSLVSSLFDASQRSGWLAIRPTERHHREQRFLAYLKEAGVLTANAFGSSLGKYQLEPIRQPNVFAAFAVINNNKGRLDFSSSDALAFSEQDNELRVQLRQFAAGASALATSVDRYSSEELEDQQQQALNEFRVHSSVLRELTGKGTLRLLVIDVRKPNYSLMEQQLESAYASSAPAAQELDAGSWLSVLDGSQLYMTRVFGVFAIVGETGDALDGSQQSRPPVGDLLAQWPISVDFRTLSSPQQAATAAAANSYQPQVARACSALDLSTNDGSLSQRAPNGEELEQQPCKTYKANSTSHVCRCNRFGFVSLVSFAPQQQLGADMTRQWPPTLGGNQLDNSALDQQQQQLPSYIGAQGKLGQQQQQTVGTWTAIFIAFGLFLLVVCVSAFLINVFLKLSAQSRLSKKPGFFATAAGFGSHAHRDLSSGPTTGPLVDHSLVGGAGPGADSPLVTAAVAHNNNGTTTSGSIIGLTQSAYQGYKAHQQSAAAALYAAHLPGGAGHHHHRRNRLQRWLQLAGSPSRWLGARLKDDRMSIQHRVIGASLSGSSTGGAKTPSGGSSAANSAAYLKSTYQNGYTTALGLHHHHQHAPHHSIVAAAATAAPSSSTSSYVSSSAYYEEIGPGNLTKVNTNQLAGAAGQQSRTQTLIEPFKRSPVGQQQQHSVVGQQATLWIQQQPNSNGAAYPLDQSSYAGGHAVSMLPVSGFQNSKQIQNNDLNQLQQQHQQSAGSGGSQHSTPRHYLFASSSAVSAYKNSMSQQQQQATTLSHHHHCQQMQFKTNQDHRFVPN